jgi:hypothetical protein
MGKCIFRTDEIKRVVKHALESREWHGDSPGIVLQDDFGLYCVSNGLPADVVEAEFIFCAYARECNPHRNNLFERKTLMLVGYAGLQQFLPVNEQYLAHCDEFAEMVIDVDDEEIEVSFRKPK